MTYIEIEYRSDPLHDWRSLADDDDDYNVPYTPDLLEAARKEFPTCEVRAVRVEEIRTPL